MTDDDPRVAKTRATVLDTGTELLVEGGPGAFTIEAIVARSGVARSTIYRHWPTRDELLLDVFDHCSPTFDPPGPDLSFQEAAREFLYAVVQQLSDPKWARMLPALMMLKAYETSVADIEQRVYERQMAVVGVLFQRGIDDGLLPPDLDQEQAVALLVGPLIFALLTGAPKLSPQLADAALHGFVAGFAGPRPR